jgi:hypothetical protein
MPVYEVKKVGDEPREWSSSHGGTFLSYTVDLQEEAGPVAIGVEWTKKPESKPPTVGERVAGHLEDGRYGDKFKIDYEATKELGGSRTSVEASTGTAGSRNAGKGNWQSEQERDPERSARILRQHSQSAALQWAQMLPDEGKSLTLATIFQFADAFDQDVIQAGQAAVQAQGSAPPDNERRNLPPSDSPGSEQQSADPSLTEIEQALDTAGLIGPAASIVATYMLAELEPERTVQAIRKLTGSDLEAQSEALAALKTLTEKHRGEPLPTNPNPDDAIPF